MSSDTREGATACAESTCVSDAAGVESAQEANRPGDATNVPGHDTEGGSSMPNKSTTSCTHCFCRSKTVAVDALAVKTKRVRFCCWCGEEKS